MENNVPKGKELSLDELINIDRWLLNKGMISESVKQNLLGYGYLAHGNTLDIEVAVDAEKKILFYKIFLSAKDAKKYLKFKKKLTKYQKSDSILSKLLQIRLLKKYTKYNLDSNLNRFIKDYLPEFTVEIEIETQAVTPTWVLLLLGMKKTKILTVIKKILEISFIVSVTIAIAIAIYFLSPIQ